MQPDLFVEQASSVTDLPVATIGYDDSILNFRRYQEPCRHGLGFSDEPEMCWHVECSLPSRARITETYEQYGMKRTRNFTIYGHEEHKSAGELINWWLEQKDYKTGLLNRESEAGKWILKNAKELNTARRIWSAHIKNNEVERLEFQLRQLQNTIRVAKLDLGVVVKEAALDKPIQGVERQVLLKELGATDEDLSRMNAK